MSNAGGSRPVSGKSLRTGAGGSSGGMAKDEEADGLFPGHVLARYHVIFDYPAGELTLAEPGTVEPRGEPLPMGVSEPLMLASPSNSPFLRKGEERGIRTLSTSIPLKYPSHFPRPFASEGGGTLYLSRPRDESP